MRRVVTGHRNGKSVILEDKEIPGQDMISGEFFTLWKTEGIPVIPLENEDYKQPLLFQFPEPGGTLLLLCIHKPDEIYWKRAREEGIDLAEIHRKTFNDEQPMHTSDTIDYNIILSGELWMEVDDGVEVHLKPFDCVVQNGTRHGWYNRSSEDCVIATFQIGAKRQ